MKDYKEYTDTLDVLRSSKDKKITGIMAGFPKSLFKIVSIYENDIGKGVGFDFHNIYWEMTIHDDLLLVRKDNFDKGEQEFLYVYPFSKVNKLSKGVLKDAAVYCTDNQEGRINQTVCCFFRVEEGYKLYYREQNIVEGNVKSETDNFATLESKYFQNGFELVSMHRKQNEQFDSKNKKAKVETYIKILEQDNSIKKILNTVLEHNGEVTLAENNAIVEYTDENKNSYEFLFNYDAQFENVKNNKPSKVFAKFYFKRADGLEIREDYRLGYNFIKPPYGLIYDEDEKPDEFYVDNKFMVTLQKTTTKSKQGFVLQGKEFSETICEVDLNTICKDGQSK